MPEVKFLRPTHPYIPMARGFVYLAVVLDWFSRRILAWRLSITMEVSFSVAALEDALAHHGKPAIVNTDQGSQFTGSAFTRSPLNKASRSAWMAKALGGTMCSSSGCGAPSNTRRYICEPMKASAMHALRSAAICTSKKKVKIGRKHGSRRRSA